MPKKQAHLFYENNVNCLTYNEISYLERFVPLV